MAKLWADISAATPQGVHVEALRLAPEQGLSLQGTAETTDVLNTLQANLNATQLFEKLKVVRSESTSSGVSFDLSADISGPHNAVAKPADDWAAKSLSMRLYGEESAGGGAAGGEGPEGASAGRTERGGERRSGRAEETTGARPAAKALDVPGPISDEAIAALDFSKASLEWVKRKSAAAKVADAAVKARLEDEMKKIDERRTKLKSGGGA